MKKHMRLFSKFDIPGISINEKNLKKEIFWICDSCSGYKRYPKEQIEEIIKKENKTLTKSSCSGWDFCSVCGNYGHFKNPYYLEAKVLNEEHEECNCIEEHGKVLHNDGGNYHLSFYEVKDIKLKER
jgi:hypothetical protein